MGVMQGFVETIHLFKTQPDIVVPMLQCYVKIEDRKAAGNYMRSTCPGSRRSPGPSFPGMPALQEFLVKKYPAAASLREAEADIADSSFIDELAGNGFIDRLYAADRK